MPDQERARSEEAGPPPTILVVDDDAEMRAVLRDILIREGFAVREEPGGERVIALLESLRPAAIVLDKEMPGPTGLDLLTYVSRRHPGIPVILVTAFGGPGVRAEAERRGAVAYLEKPFRVASLVSGLRAVLERHPAPPAPEPAARRTAPGAGS